MKIPIMLVLALLAVSVSPAQASPIASAGDGIDPYKHRHVLKAVALMYAPMPDNHSDWLDVVCENMTAGGCAYFTGNLESMLWQKGQDAAFNSVWFTEVVAALDDGSQVWKTEMTIYRGCGDASENCPSVESDIYLHVVYDEAQDKWLLNRVMHGPYIDFPQFEEQ